MMGTARAYAPRSRSSRSPPPRGPWLRRWRKLPRLRKNFRANTPTCYLLMYWHNRTLRPNLSYKLKQILTGLSKAMLGQDVLPISTSQRCGRMSRPNRTYSQIAPITTAQLNEQILKYLKPEITLAPQAPV